MGIREPLAAWRLKCGWGCFLSVGAGGSADCGASVDEECEVIGGIVYNHVEDDW